MLNWLLCRVERFGSDVKTQKPRLFLIDMWTVVKITVRQAQQVYNGTQVQPPIWEPTSVETAQVSLPKQSRNHHHNDPLIVLILLLICITPYIQFNHNSQNFCM